MKRLFTAANLIDGATSDILESLLREAEIPCMIRNEHLSMAKGEIPITECYPELWVLDDDDYSRAKELLEMCRNSKSEVHDAWACPRCNETIEGQFTSCWKCGQER
ncbi:MAG: DUF2007 domain-containing protein [Acidobacteriota bacterium]|nr:DUF2007 domain-containing protein [Acidobacteriota bacterium]